VKNAKDILHENPDSLVFARYADELASQDRIDEAIEVLENGINKHPHYAPGYSVRANILFMQNSDEQAVKEVQRALQLDPQMPRDLFRLGANFLENQKPETANAYLWATLKFEPDVFEVIEAYEQSQTREPPKQDLGLSQETEKALSEFNDESVSEEHVVEAEMMEPEGEFEELMSKSEQPPESMDMESSLQEEISADVSEVEAETEITGTSLPESEELEELIAESEQPSESVDMESTIKEEIPADVSEEKSEALFTETLISEIDESEEESTEQAQEGDTEQLITSEEFAFLEDLQEDESEKEDLQFQDEKVEEEIAGESFEDVLTDTISEFGKITEPEPIGDRDTADVEIQEPSDDENILEIKDTEAYDLSEFDFEISGDDNEKQVLSEEEREKLLAFERMPDDADEQAVEDVEALDFDQIQKESETPQQYLDDKDVKDITDTKEDIETEDVYIKEEESSSDAGPKELFTDLSKEEIDILNISDFDQDETDGDLAAETEEGIDYNDIFPENKIIQEDEETLSVDTEEIETENEEKYEISTDNGGESQNDLFSAPELIEDELAEDVSDFEKTDELIDSFDSEISISEETSYKSLKIVEDIIKSTPRIDMPSNQNIEKEIEDSSLDELIDSYVHTIDEDVENPQPDDAETADSLEQIFENTAETSEDISEEKEVTITMAEIYVSQGLLKQALEIFNVLLKRNPDNEEIKNRMEELRHRLEQQTDSK